jgi:hypothetical protein
MVNYGFDTVDCRVRYAWDGDFLDMRPQWAVKGETLPKILGRIFWRTGPDFGVRIGDPAMAAPPRFRGHRVREGLPELYYDVATTDERATGSPPIRVDERIEAAPSGLGLVHHYEVGESAAAIRFVARGCTGGTVRVLDGSGRELPLASEGCWLVAPRGPAKFTVAIAAEAAH